MHCEFLDSIFPLEVGGLNCVRICVRNEAADLSLHRICVLSTDKASYLDLSELAGPEYWVSAIS